MSLDSLNRWLTLLANIGVIAGIVFLAIEVRQNQLMLEESNRLNRVMARVEDVDTFNSWRGQWVQSNELSRIYSEGNAGLRLTEIEAVRYSNLCTSELWTHLKLFERALALKDEEAATKSIAIVAEYMLPANPGLRQCWGEVKVGMLAYGSDEFVSRVDAALIRATRSN